MLQGSACGRSLALHDLLKSKAEPHHLLFRACLARLRARTSTSLSHAHPPASQYARQRRHSTRLAHAPRVFARAQGSKVCRPQGA
eukprot:scaffold226847_cov36-Tisochrysis_lutea.AAC.3